MARRAGYFETLRESGEPIVTVDAGDWRAGTDELARIRGRHLLGALGDFGIDAMAVGEQDLLEGLAPLTSLADSTGVPLVVANVKRKPDGEEFAPSYVIRTIGDRRIGPFRTGGFRVGIFGLLAPRETLLPGVPRDSIAVEDATEAARRMVTELRERRGCRVVIALAHTGMDPARKLAREVPGIDLVVVGHGGGPLEVPERYGEAFLVHAGDQGATIGEITYNIGRDGGPILESHRIVTFEAGSPESEHGKLRTEAYQKDYRKFLEDPQEYPPDLKRQPQIFASADACASCHAAETAQWRATRHATAFASLEETGDDITPECVRCHVTAYGWANGFRHRKWTPQFENVQCEACHGPSAAHAEYQRARGDGRPHPAPPPFTTIHEPLCRECHDAKNDPDFEYQSALAKIAHRAHR